MDDRVDIEIFDEDGELLRYGSCGELRLEKTEVRFISDGDEDLAKTVKTKVTVHGFTAEGLSNGLYATPVLGFLRRRDPAPALRNTLAAAKTGAHSYLVHVYTPSGFAGVLQACDSVGLARQFPGYEFVPS